MQTARIAAHADTSNATGRTPDELRIGLHQMWSAVADRWADHADHVDARAARLTDALLARAGLKPGDRVLELAAGPGGAGLAAAERVGPSGEVVVSDFAAEMTAIASARAQSRGLANVTTRVRDLEQIDEPDSSFDVVLCREGLMLVPDPARAAREIRRVLRPHGRAAISVWGRRECNPWLGLMFDAVSAQLGCPVPPPGIPGPFSLEEANKLSALLTDAQLSDVVVAELPVPLSVASFDEWWTVRSALAGPLTQILASLPDTALRAIRHRAHEAARPYATAHGFEFPGVALVAGGRRA
jgi:ubiquinone/menaquinone biosynthesis C-methylase UbiE